MMHKDETLPATMLTALCSSKGIAVLPSRCAGKVESSPLAQLDQLALQTSKEVWNLESRPLCFDDVEA
jgi:hypothetical protein